MHQTSCYATNLLMKILLTLILSIYSFSLLAHEDITRVPIDCSTEVIKGMVLEDGAMVSKPQRRTNFAIPINFVKEHYEIPEMKFGHYQLSVVAEGIGDYKFKDVVSIPIGNKDGKLNVVDPFGVPWKQVTEEEVGMKIDNVECYLIN